MDASLKKQGKASVAGRRLLPKTMLLLCGRRRLVVLPAEALDAACGIHQLLLARKERVTGGANFNVDVALMGGTGRKCITARAMDAYFVIIGVNGCLHVASKPFLQKDSLAD
jgi:hypothetical protein